MVLYLDLYEPAIVLYCTFSVLISFTDFLITFHHLKVCAYLSPIEIMEFSKNVVGNPWKITAAILWFHIVAPLQLQECDFSSLWRPAHCANKLGWQQLCRRLDRIKNIKHCSTMHLLTPFLLASVNRLNDNADGPLYGMCFFLFINYLCNRSVKPNPLWYFHDLFRKISNHVIIWMVFCD